MKRRNLVVPRKPFRVSFQTFFLIEHFPSILPLGHLAIVQIASSEDTPSLLDDQLCQVYRVPILSLCFFVIKKGPKRHFWHVF